MQAENRQLKARLLDTDRARARSLPSLASAALGGSSSSATPPMLMRGNQAWSHAKRHALMGAHPPLPPQPRLDLNTGGVPTGSSGGGAVSLSALLTSRLDSRGAATVLLSGDMSSARSSEAGTEITFARHSSAASLAGTHHTYSDYGPYSGVSADLTHAGSLEPPHCSSEGSRASRASSGVLSGSTVGSGSGRRRRLAAGSAEDAASAAVVEARAGALEAVGGAPAGVSPLPAIAHAPGVSTGPTQQVIAVTASDETGVAPPTVPFISEITVAEAESAAGGRSIGVGGSSSVRGGDSGGGSGGSGHSVSGVQPLSQSALPPVEGITGTILEEVGAGSEGGPPSSVALTLPAAAVARDGSGGAPTPRHDLGGVLCTSGQAAHLAHSQAPAAAAAAAATHVESSMPRPQSERGVWKPWGVLCTCLCAAPPPPR